MLLDEKRTKRIVRIVAILTSIAFAGVGAIVIALVIFGGTPTASEQAVKDARARVETAPNDPDALSNLAGALRADGKVDEAITTAQKAVQIAPRRYDATRALVAILIQEGRRGEAITALQEFTARNPKEPDAFLQLGQLAQQAGRTPLARLSYQAYLRLNPQGATPDSVRQALADLNSPNGGQ